MKIIDHQWDKLSLNEKEHPAAPDEIFVCGGCQPGWPPYFVGRVKGKRNRIDHEHLGLFWERDLAVAFAELVEKIDAGVR